MISFEIENGLEQMIPSWTMDKSFPTYKLLDTAARVDNIDNYKNLYDYLEKEYMNDEEISFKYDLDRFMSEWIEDNISSDAMYESIVGTELLGYHYRNYNINHKTRMIELFIANSEVNNEDKHHLAMSITATKEQLFKILDVVKESK